MVFDVIVSLERSMHLNLNNVRFTAVIEDTFVWCTSFITEPVSGEELGQFHFDPLSDYVFD